MRLKLKETPREWRKFTLAWTIIPIIPIWFFVPTFPKIAFGLFVITAIGLIWPRTMRIPYRVIMTGSFHVGQVVGRVLLTLFFLLLLTPIALLLKLMGKDLLQIKKIPRDTYWEKAPAESAHDRMF